MVRYIIFQHAPRIHGQSSSQPHSETPKKKINRNYCHIPYNYMYSKEKVSTYDQRVWKTGLSIRSAVLKPHVKGGQPSFLPFSRCRSKDDDRVNTGCVQVVWGDALRVEGECLVMDVGEQSHAKPNSAFEKILFYKYAIASLEHHLFLLHFLASCISRDVLTLLIVFINP